MKDSQSKNIDPDESFESEYNNNANYDRIKITSKSKTRQRKAFYLSNGMPIKDRVMIFKQDFPEFAALDDDWTKKLIKLYDHRLNKPYVKSDPAINTVGGILIWTGWIFMTCAAGYDIVDFDHKHVPQKIAMNVVLAGSGGGIMHQLI